MRDYYTAVETDITHLPSLLAELQDNNPLLEIQDVFRITDVNFMVIYKVRS